MGDIPTGTDVVVIGAGPGGYVAAIRAAQLGKDVTLVERDQLGGLCLNYGCIPSKALIHAASFVHDLANLHAFGINVENVKVDAKKVFEWRQGVIKQLRDGIAYLLKKNNVTVIRGDAHFESENRVKIATEQNVAILDFQNAIIATGSRPRALPGFAFDGSTVLSSREALGLDHAPDDLLVIGGGYIGVELGEAYAALGSRVKIVEIGPQLLPGNDPDAVAVIEKHMRDAGIEIYLNAKCDGLEKTGNKARTTLVQGNNRTPVTVDKILVAVGHAPNTQGVHLENAGVQLDDKGFIKVDKQLRTTNPRVFAVGDIAGQPMLAHKAYAEGKIAAEVISGNNVAFENKVVPAVIFAEPEFAYVGLQENQLKQQGINYKAGKFPFKALGRALTMNEPEGFCKVLMDPDSHLLLGIEIVGPNASDLIGEAAVALEMNATADDLALTIHPHPTLNEVLTEAAAVALGKGVHV